MSLNHVYPLLQSGTKLLCSLVVFASLCSSSAMAADGMGKIAFVDMQGVEKKSMAVMDVVKKLQDKQRIMQEQLDAQSKDLQQKAEDLEKNKSFLSRQVLEARTKELQNRFASFQRDTQMKNATLQQAKEGALGEIDGNVKEIIANIATKEKYDMVLANQFTLFANLEAYPDITEAVVKILNTKIKSIDINKYFNQGEGSIGAKSSGATKSSK